MGNISALSGREGRAHYLHARGSNALHHTFYLLVIIIIFMVGWEI